ncbi:hypothetical protein SOVF_026550, partial [Spinacia oleracea]
KTTSNTEYGPWLATSPAYSEYEHLPHSVIVRIFFCKKLGENVLAIAYYKKGKLRTEEIGFQHPGSRDRRSVAQV